MTPCFLLDGNNVVKGAINISKCFDVDIEPVYFPPGGWQKYGTANVATSFSTSSVHIASSTGVDVVSLSCAGIASAKVIIRDKNTSSSLKSYVIDIDDGSNPYSRRDIIFKTPWSCCDIDVILQNDAEIFFATVLKVSVFCETLPSSLSTPAKPTGHESKSIRSMTHYEI